MARAVKPPAHHDPSSSFDNHRPPFFLFLFRLTILHYHKHLTTLPPCSQLAYILNPACCFVSSFALCGMAVGRPLRVLQPRFPASNHYVSLPKDDGQSQTTHVAPAVPQLSRQTLQLGAPFSISVTDFQLVHQPPESWNTCPIKTRKDITQIIILRTSLNRSPNFPLSSCQATCGSITNRPP